ncbi:helix-turn-helix domain-containing protein [Longitalea luteola]|uniref:helix-turn-helix domain-containing protein n=1 Tax=Longitalea luteola TaxID=2812563 RepID=UPI001A958312|nr:helix-turn-helix domain-containing protein [Longitalea luteola]
MAFSTDTSNQLFQLAVRFVNQTNRHLFLTGKAGTGKTTFLKYIRDNTFKKLAIVAPTGVAAINAGGVTLHSFFQLPHGSFIPATPSGWNGNSFFNTPHTLLQNLRLNNDKKLLLQELELLIIDEVSMLRADILDEIDCILRHARRKQEPFGGIQVLYIGDLFQLPPVAKNDEWDVLRHHYRSPFFFDAQALQQQPPLYLELKKIYRQHEQEFINVLNNIRNNKTTNEDLDLLHKHYLPGYESAPNESYITLTTHNARADTINQQQLNRLPGELYEFKAEVSGDFNERAFPADQLLQLKPGAQIMFIKNDKGESRRFFNGKIATISRIAGEEVYVRFEGDEHDMLLEKETWRNIRYQYNNEEDKIEEEEVGSFKQFPVRLAWAITIHKSQGLTFEKAIIDAGASFAPGQVYVALSRLTSLSGLVLYSRIHPSSINTDERVLAFTRLEREEDQLAQELQHEQRLFLTRSLVRTFDWLKLAEAMQMHFEGYEARQIPDKNTCVLWAKELLEAVLKQQEMADKFTRQLEQLLPNAPQDGYRFLHERVKAGSTYFSAAMEAMETAIKEHIAVIKVKPKVKKYVSTLQQLLLLPQRKKQQLQQAVQITEGLVNGVDTPDLLARVEENKRSESIRVVEEAAAKTTKPQRGDSNRISLQLFKEGKNIEEIASVRGLAPSTIEGHLIPFIKTGDIDIKDIVAEDKLAVILQAVEELNLETLTLTPIKEKLGDAFSYTEIKAALSYLDWLQVSKAAD